MSEKNNKKISKMMSLVLRHKPSHIGVQLDENGWVSVKELINGIKNKGVSINEVLLKEIVEGNDKQRFIFSDDGLNIRANQGHSIEVDVQLNQVEPPEVLYHGTVQKFIENIKKEGLIKMNRLHVHLSKDKETAVKVGSRRGQPIILEIDAASMHKEGISFFLSENGVWLTDFVSSDYIKNL
jgi:putative RNA 2'-phosphotransferase